MHLNKILKARIDKLHFEKKTLYVLKGIDIKLILNIDIEIEKILSNKIAYFFSIVNERNVVTYEEYILLHEFITSQYSEIIIINNDLYINYIPLYINIERKILENILGHFLFDNNIEEYEGLSEYLNIYGKMEEVEDKIYVVYNNLFENEKVSHISLFKDIKLLDLELTENRNKQKVFKIIDEISYIEFLEKINEVPNILIDSKINLKENILYANRIKMLNNLFKEDIFIRIYNTSLIGLY